MATTATAATPSTQGADAEGEDAEEAGRTRLPRVVVRMSQGMFDALKAYCDTNSVLPTALGRTLLAQEIGWDLSKDPEAPGSATRTRYASDADRSSAKDLRRAYNRLLRKALYQSHLAALHKRPELLATATQTIAQISDKSKTTLASIQSLDAKLDEAIKAAK